MAVKIIRSKKSFATLSNARSFAPLHKRGKESPKNAKVTANRKSLILLIKTVA